jgi:uncharacterized tellurite resistance protein B-like protein
MSSEKFKYLLFDIACGAVTCDGHIDAKEIEELKSIDKSTAYFSGIDLSRKLNTFIKSFNEDANGTIDKVYKSINKESLNPVEELLILEIVLRLIYSDTKLDENEVHYIKVVRSKLSISDEIIKQRFGEIDLLLRQESSRMVFSDKKSNINTKALNEMIDTDPKGGLK